MADTKEEQKVLVIEKPVRYYGGGDVVGVFADLAIVSHGTGSFNLSFYQIHTPETEQLAAFEALTDIPARCIMRVVLAPGLIEQLYDAIGKNIEKSKATQSLVAQHKAARKLEGKE